ncbi:hypothetical protein FB45DRAFT_928438 [Roridomyces roridus]|uniref:Uncharacterized protein n=1 Tax=Roridomyces roridus TaxID=1738132 RepID=A0AAD7BHN7_9AGAR|nr:hypothetical protein FB45DRAFT_928438 [Roridomyces roridus]
MIAQPTHGQGANALHRVLRFPSFEHLVKFTHATRSLSGGTITVFPNYDADIYLQSPEGVTRTLIRLAVETETAYLSTVGTALPGVPYVKPFYKVMSLEYMHFMTSQLKINHGPVPPRAQKVLVPPENLRLTPAPPVSAAWPHQPLVKKDLRLYLRRLVCSGWAIMPLKTRAPELQGLPSLYRAYYFRDYATAREFFHMVVSRMPVPAQGSEEGVEVRLVYAWTQFPYKVCVWSISELDTSALPSADDLVPPPSPSASRIPTATRYGISHADIRFAIQLESEVITQWAGKADRSATRNRWFPTKLWQIWGTGYKRWYGGRGVAEPGEYIR